MKKRIYLLVSIIIILSFSLVGCGTSKKEAKEEIKGDPAEVLNKYYEKVKDSNFEAAYDLLSDDTKSRVSKEDFILFQKTRKEAKELKDTKVEKLSDYKEKELGDIKFKNVVEFDVTNKFHTYYDDKDDTINFKKYVVNSNGSWKIYNDNDHIKADIASSLVSVSFLYAEGKGGKTQDIAQSATILNQALKYDDNNSIIYYLLAKDYYDLKRYDDVINAANTYIQKGDKNEGLSEGYNVLGLGYAGKGQKDKAIEYFNKSIELNPNNQYTKTNLENIKRY